MTTAQEVDQTVDAVVIGAGFAGMYALHRLRDDLGLDVRVFERGSGVGGTWFWNRYPGARCDVESMYYSYSFSEDLEQEWQWTERYPTQPEILDYANHVADRFGLRDTITFDTSVDRADFDEGSNTWVVTTDAGEVVRAKFLITAVGCLSTSQLPAIDGLSDFTGRILHTGQWPHEGVDLEGKRVAVIGTGSSGVQAIPEIARQAQHLTVFQRTPPFVLPAGNRPLDPENVADIKSRYRDIRESVKNSVAGTIVEYPIGSALELDEETRRRELDRRWAVGGSDIMATFTDTSVNLEANAVLADYVRERIASDVKSPDLAAHLSPQTYPIGAKRICIGTDYYTTYNRENVTLVDIRNSPITAVTAQGIVAGDEEHEVDVIVFATGYDAVTGAINGIDINGVGGRSLRETWETNPQAYLGLSSAGFPNLFFITGPGSPSVLVNVIVSIEQHVDWIHDLLIHVRDNNIDRVEAQPAAQDDWSAHIAERSQSSFLSKTANWQTGANIPGKAQVFLLYVGGMGPYRKTCDEVAAAGYTGFTLTPARQSAIA
ncbi:flavin-containing monooxygenase [Rhodococcoides yunnanense]|uniref:flavin-containing monooxygenase n=1 Tax=Rhodococcoides yunnanense TaxID=278209 RepID=UPI0009330E0D|nr:NAD(P)/FAD-dependent oxidoreductase [Rhodococcus yunnanensis]